jgi:hypothetical protein
MMSTKNKSGACIIALALCAALAAPLWGQGRRQRNNPGQGANAPLQILKQELNKAGAVVLDSDQEAALGIQVVSILHSDQIARIQEELRNVF